MEFQVLGKALGFQGLNFDLIEELLPDPDAPNYLRDAENVIVKNGVISKLQGTELLNSIASQLGEEGARSILGTPIYEKLDGTKYLMVVTPSKLYVLHDDTTYQEVGDIDDGTNDSVLSWAVLDDKFIFVLSDSGIIYTWDGTTFGTLFSSPDDEDLKARFLLGYKNHLILVRTIEEDTEYYQRIWPSYPGDIDRFDDEDKMDIDIGGKILNVRDMENEFYVYFKDAAYRIYWGGTDMGWLPERIVANEGIIAPKTLTGDKGTHFYLSKEGLMSLTSGSIPMSISSKKFDSLILDEIDPVYFYRAIAHYYPHLKLLYLAYPRSGSTFNDRQIIYDTSVGELVSKKTLSSDRYTAYGVFEKDLSGLSSDARKLLGLSFVPILGTSEGYVKEKTLTAYQDGAEMLTSSFRFPLTFFKEPRRNKRVLQVDLLIEKLTADPITLVVDISNDGGETYSYTYTMEGPSGTGIKRYEIRSDDDGVGVDCFGKEFIASISDSNNPNGFRFHGIIFMGYYATQK